MRRIRKGAQPRELAAWRRRIRPRGFIPPWGQLTNPPSGAMRDALATEQRQLCCYCTGSIVAGNFHIEHFCPRAADRTFTYIWFNLLASCQGGDPDIVGPRRHCGAAKDNWFVVGVTVDPRRAGVEALFRFPLSGKIFPAKHLDANRYRAVDTTITKLNLNAPSLVSRRAAILSRANMDVVSLDRATWRRRYLEEQDGQLQEFWPALNYNFELHWATLLTLGPPTA